MTRKINYKKYESQKYADFLKVAQSFGDAATLAISHGYYNAAGVLIIHSAIAYADAITIKFSSQKVSGESHYDIIALLKNVLPSHLKNDSAMQHFKKMIDHKNIVSYSGDVYSRPDIDKLNKHFIRFITWAKNITSL